MVDLKGKKRDPGFVENRSWFVTFSELKELLEQKGLKKSGIKAQLIARLLGEDEPERRQRSKQVTNQSQQQGNRGKQKKVPRWGTKHCKGKPLLEYMIMNGLDLYQDGYLEGKEVPAAVIHQSCDEFKIYDAKNFDVNLKKLRITVKEKKLKAVNEEKAFREQVVHCPSSQFHVKGLDIDGTRVMYPKWSGHVAQKLLRFDIQNGCLDHKMPTDDSTWFSAVYPTPSQRMTPEKLQASRPIYRLWPLKVFRDHIKQEIKAIKQHEWNIRHEIYGYEPSVAPICGPTI